LSEQTSGLIVKLTWPSDHLSAGNSEHVTIELRETNGRSVALLSVPEDKLHQELSRILYPCVDLSPDGSISTYFEECVQRPEVGDSVAVDQLIAEAVSPEMLEDELEAAQMLSKFRDRLLKSLEHVEQAIASLPKD
jgi:hypothetical protein